MDEKIGKILGWLTIAAGAIWFGLGYFDALGFSWEDNLFMGAAVPFFGMCTGALLIWKG